MSDEYIELEQSAGRFFSHLDAGKMKGINYLKLRSILKLWQSDDIARAQPVLTELIESVSVFSAPSTSIHLVRVPQARARGLGESDIDIHKTLPRPRSAEDQIQTLKQEKDELLLRTQLLESRGAEDRRRAEEAIREKDRIRSQLDNLLEAHGITAEGNNQLLRVLIAKDAASLKMVESFHGIVEHVHEDQVVVTYDTDGDPVEHVYERDQFPDGRLPEVGERVIVSVFLASRSPQSGMVDEPSSTESSKDRPPRFRKNVIRGPHSF